MTWDNTNEPGSVPLYEREVQNYLAKNLQLLNEEGLKLIQTEYPVEFGNDKGRIDILAEDKTGKLVVIEVKRGRAGREAVGQIQSYMGAILRNSEGRGIRGILVAAEIDEVARSALLVASIELFLFKTHFEFKREVCERPIGSVGSANFKKNYWEKLGGNLLDEVYECSHCCQTTRIVQVGASKLCGLCGRVAR